MNEKLPFEDAFERQMNEMQTPFENESWQKMKGLLEQKKKRRPFTPFGFYRILGFMLLITLIFTGIIIYYRNTSEKAVANSSNKSTAPGTNQTSESTRASDEVNRLNTLSNKDDSNTITNKKYVTVNTNKNATKAFVNKTKKPTSTVSVISRKPGAVIKGNNKINNAISKANTTKSTIISDRLKNKRVNEKVLQTNHDFDLAGKNIKRRNKVIAGKEMLFHQKAGKVKVNEDFENKKLRTNADRIQSDAKPPGSINRDMETVSNIQMPKELKPDTIALFQTLTPPQSLRLNNTVANIIKAAELKKAGLRSRKYFVAAGLGIHQEVPVSGQKAAAYNYNGNKNIVTDYIPSVYVRLEKNRHWFLQGEFSYAAPQLIKPFSYQQQTTQNFSGGAYTIHSTSIKKTFYNKVPVSFNYYISPCLSIGVGAAYSWLHSAVAKHEILTKDLTTQQQTITSQLVAMKGYRDSFLYRSHTYLLLQVNYNIKRFSFALGFEKALQPYIKYTLPDGTIFKEKNWSLDFALRFRLYQSRNFSLLSRRTSKPLKPRKNPVHSSSSSKF